jgi:hypothetical protein
MQCDARGEAMEREVVAMKVIIAGRRALPDQPGGIVRWFGVHITSDLAIGDAAAPDADRGSRYRSST